MARITIRTVKDLKQILDVVKEDTPVVVPGIDHSFHTLTRASLEYIIAVGDGGPGTDYYEYHGQGESYLEDEERLVHALILGEG